MTETDEKSECDAKCLEKNMWLRSSQRLEGQVVEQMENDVAEQEDDALPLDQRGLLVHQPRYLSKHTVDGHKLTQYLPLASFDVFRIEVALLEEGEPQLCRCRCIRVG